MADDEILRRIDRSLDRIDGHMERGNQLTVENRWFTRDLVRRQEKFMQEVVAEFARQRAVTEELLVTMRHDHREMIAELRAQRGALFKMLDRLDGGDAPASA